ncbi:MAG: hypothetical protein AAF573_20825, partial [Bacteroidota bacterium]
PAMESYSIKLFWLEYLSGTKFLRINLSGDTIPIEGMVEQTTTSSFNKRIYNTYSLLDIPILVGYETYIGDKWKIGIEGGVLANLSLQTEGTIPDMELNDINLEDNQDQYFKSNVGLSYQVGLSVSRRFWENVELSIAPTVRWLPTDFSVSQNPIGQKYTMFGMHAGIRYFFR